MKKIIAAVIGGVLLIAALFIALKPASFDEQLQKSLAGLDRYHMTANMEMLSGEDVKSYDIMLCWQKKNDTEFYRVALLDKSLNQEQIILRNADGVYVLTPSLNQAFKFKGDWPNNSPKPYLYQSRMGVLNGKYSAKKEKDGWFVTADVDYPNSPQLVKQEMKFDKEFKPVWVKVYNDNGTVEVKIEFKETDFKPEFSATHFDVNENLKANQTTVNVSADLPLYPVYVFDARLVNSSVASIGKETRHILEFSGEKSFTIVQVQKKRNAEPVVQQVSGELVDAIDVFGAFDGTRLTVYDNNVEYTIYSQDLSPEEMLQVVTSMQVAVMK